MNHLFVSKDDGKTFAHLGDVPDLNGVQFRCCETIFELPQRVGDLKAGTLLFAATYVDQEATQKSYGAPPSPTFPGVFAIDVYESTDHGQHWDYLSTPVSGSGERGAGGLWEPEFLLTREGALVMFWSDETYSCCSQKLMKTRSVDGRTWKNTSEVVSTTNPQDRPGMIVVREMPTGTFFMTYEMCGSRHCDVFYRLSKDGWYFGPPSDPGSRIQNEAGQFFRHAPAVVWTPSPFSPDGMIVVVGQMLYDANGVVGAQNGTVLFVNSRLDGSGAWHTVQSPVRVPNAFNNPCPNYSTALLPTHDGTGLLEIATDFFALNKCEAFSAIKPWQDLMSSNVTQDSMTPER